MSDIKKFMDIMMETTAGATSSGSVATVAQPMMATERRINPSVYANQGSKPAKMDDHCPECKCNPCECHEESRKAPDAPKAKEFGLWQNSVLAGKEQKSKKTKKKTNESTLNERDFGSGQRQLELEETRKDDEDGEGLDPESLKNHKTIRRGIEKMSARHAGENYTPAQMAALRKRLDAAGAAADEKEAARKARIDKPYSEYAPDFKKDVAEDQHLEEARVITPWEVEYRKTANGQNGHFYVIKPREVYKNARGKSTFDNERAAQDMADFLNRGGEGDSFYDRPVNVAETSVKGINVQQLATISDEALDNAYHYGRSSPGNTFGWQANLKSAAYAKHMIDKGVTDIEAISDAIHKGWNVTAKAFVQNPDQFDDTEKLKAAGKLEAKLQQREKLMNIGYAQLPNDEQEKDRVVARALLQAMKGQQDLGEGSRKAWLKHNDLVDLEPAITKLTSEFEKFLLTDPEEQQKHQQGTKQRLKTKPMNGPSGILPEQRIDEISKEVIRNYFPKGADRARKWSQSGNVKDVARSEKFANVDAKSAFTKLTDPNYGKATAKKQNNNDDIEEGLRNKSQGNNKR